MYPKHLASWLFLTGLFASGCGGTDEAGNSEDSPALKNTGGKNTGGKGGKGGKGGTGGSSTAGGAAGDTGSTAGAGGAAAGAGGAKAGAGGATAGAGGAAAGSGAAGGKAGAAGASGGAGGSAGAGGVGSCISGQDCDDGNECTTDTCSGAKCLNSPKNPPDMCAGGAKVCVAGVCVAPGCGDGIKQDGEECDDGDKDDFDDCSNVCKLPKCGDGITQAGENCDDQNADDSDGCTAKCKTPGTSDGKNFDPGGEGSQGVKLDDKGNVIIDPNTAVSKTTKPVIWVSNSAEGTISKFDTQTMQEIGRYCTAPGCASDPSRTTVGLSGDAVVANRNVNSTGKFSAVRIATDELNCVDRNGNGIIDTWKGPGAVPKGYKWQAGQANSPDECVLWWSDLSAYGQLPRAAGFDAEIGEKGELSVYVYIGMFSGSLLRIDGTTGAVVKQIKVPGNPYGLVVDKDGSVWIQSTSTLVKVDVKNNDKISQHPAACMYGITADPQGRIYTSGYGQQCVRRYDPATGKNELIDLPNNGGGVAIDQNGHLWTGQKGVRIDTNGPLKILGVAKTGGHGWAIDYDGKPWSIPINGNQIAYKHDPNSASPYSNQVAKPGNGTYTYSDMTGFQLINAASKGGVFRKTFVGCGGATTTFDSLDLGLLTPANTVATVSVRVAATAADLAASPWKLMATLPPDTSPIPLGLTGGAIQVEITLKSKDLKLTPILSSITLNETNCGKD